jgi:hypothetical protein
LGLAFRSFARRPRGDGYVVEDEAIGDIIVVVFVVIEFPLQL